MALLCHPGFHRRSVMTFTDSAGAQHLGLAHSSRLARRLQCNASVDLIGTCWPRSPAGQLVVRPCPAFFYGVRYNTTSKEEAGGWAISWEVGQDGESSEGWKTPFQVPLAPDEAEHAQAIS
ncbi:hypothetical protein P7K49_010701 [Saguinus oedipus]|uniref:G-protein coupled receptors family 2 profile 1 domain-containing protein n=1 Tax=Saguinus oedipus TaxID=9490 RepID=A0ABQ9VPB5_SAGOE|nr:hypothetical protein P7K49_010701 [Saguinus oedipus]